MNMTWMKKISSMLIIVSLLTFSCYSEKVNAKTDENQKSTYAVLVLEDGTEIMENDSIKESELKNASVKIYLGKNVAAAYMTFLILYDQLKADTWDDSILKYSDVIISKKMNQYSKMAKKLKKNSIRIHKTNELEIGEQFLNILDQDTYNYFSICVCELNKKWEKQDQLFFNWKIENTK